MVLDRRLVAIARTVVGLAAIATVLIIAAICTLQAIVWAKTGMWSSLPFAQLLELAGIEIGRTYVTASGDLQARRLDFDAVIEWWLDAPAIVPLLVATALFVAFYMWLKSLEEAPQ